MTNYRGVAALTATLQNLLQDAVRAVPGAQVRAGRPDKDLGQMTPAGVINVFLYQAHPNPNWRNAELPVRRADGSLIRPPQLALDLHYLLSFYGDDSKGIPHLLLGLAATALHAEPYPSRDYIPKLEERPADPALDLGRSGLGEQAHLLRVIPLTMTHDELSKLWSIFFQVPYTLSMAYRLSVLLLEPELAPDRVPRQVLPVREPVVRPATAWLPPEIERVTPAVVPYRSGERVTLSGRHFGPGPVSARVGGVAADAFLESAGVARVRLPAGLAVGVQPVELVRSMSGGGPSGASRELYSNPASLVLLPRLTAPVRVVPCPRLAGPQPVGDPERCLEVRVDPEVGPQQRAQVLLNELSPADPSSPRAYVLPAPPREAAAGELLVPAGAVEPGTYLVRFDVDGLRTPLEVERDPASPELGRYNQPRVVIE